MQDIFKFAMKMELDGKAYYEKHAAGTDNQKLKEILLTLAEEEQRHFEIFKRLLDDEKNISGGEILAGNETLKKVQNIFEELSNESNSEPFGEEAIAVWTEALRTEEKSEKFYKEKAETDTNEGRKNLLLRIAQEENSHIMMIDGILMFLKDPATFAASAHTKIFDQSKVFKIMMAQITVAICAFKIY